MSKTVFWKVGAPMLVLGGSAGTGWVFHTNQQNRKYQVYKDTYVLNHGYSSQLQKLTQLSEQQRETINLQILNEMGVAGVVKQMKPLNEQLQDLQQKGVELKSKTSVIESEQEKIKNELIETKKWETRLLNETEHSIQAGMKKKEQQAKKHAKEEFDRKCKEIEIVTKEQTEQSIQYEKDRICQADNVLQSIPKQ